MDAAESVVTFRKERTLVHQKDPQLGQRNEGLGQFPPKGSHPQPNVDACRLRHAVEE